MKLVLALLAGLLATPASAEWVATKVLAQPGDNARNVDRIARKVEVPPVLVRCPGARPPFAYPQECEAAIANPGFDDGHDHSNDYMETTPPPEGGLPDGTVAFAPDWSTLNAAWYAGPTDRYAHGALGDRIEATTLFVERSDGSRTSVTLGDDEVFEDRSPRIADFDGFGRIHIITIVSHARKGAAVVVFAVTEEAVTRVAQTPAIGTRNRWLNIAGIADYDGSGNATIALVETPHLAGRLQFWRWSKGKLTLRAEKAGYSNHQNGSREQRLSASEDFDGDGVDDLVLPSLDRRSLEIVRFASRDADTFETYASVPLPARVDKPIGVHRASDGLVITLGLDDGSVYAVHDK